MNWVKGFIVRLFVLANCSAHHHPSIPVQGPLGSPGCPKVQTQDQRWQGFFCLSSQNLDPTAREGQAYFIGSMFYFIMFSLFCLFFFFLGFLIHNFFLFFFAWLFFNFFFSLLPICAVFIAHCKALSKVPCKLTYLSAFILFSFFLAFSFGKYNFSDFPKTFL